MKRDFDAETVRALLDELVRRLEARGVRGTIRVAGGAAMLLHYPDDLARVDPDDDLITRNPLDVIATIFGLLLLVFAVSGLAAASVVLGMASDPCGAPTVVCDYGFFRAGGNIAMYGVIAAGVIGRVIAILRLRAGRSAWWIPPLAILVAVGALLLGGDVATLGVQPGPGPE